MALYDVVFASGMTSSCLRNCEVLSNSLPSLLLSLARNYDDEVEDISSPAMFFGLKAVGVTGASGPEANTILTRVALIIPWPVHPPKAI